VSAPLVGDKVRIRNRDVEEEAAEHKFASEHLDAAAEASSDEARDAKEEKMAE
jgi:hypothetical protein